MQNPRLFLLATFITLSACRQKTETVFLDPRDRTTNMYLAYVPDTPPTACMFLMDGFGGSPLDVPNQTGLPQYAAKQGILTIIPTLKTGPLYFGTDSASQRSLRDMIESVMHRYNLQGKDFYIGGFSIGGSCALKYAELAVRDNYPIKPKAVFGVDPPLDWERFYNSAKRVIRLSGSGKLNEEVPYMVKRIEQELKGTPQTALQNYYEMSPYSFSDTTQKAIRYLVNTPVMLFSEPDIQWWLAQRGYDLSYINITDLAGAINELQRLGNKNALLVTTTDKGFRQPDKSRHPHSWNIADPEKLVSWLTGKKQ